MPKQTGKGSRKSRQSALERKATKHHDFIGEAEIPFQIPHSVEEAPKSGEEFRNELGERVRRKADEIGVGQDFPGRSQMPVT